MTVEKWEYAIKRLVSTVSRLNAQFIFLSNSQVANVTTKIQKKLENRQLHIFYKQPHFPVEPGVAIGSARNEAKNCYEVAFC